MTLTTVKEDRMASEIAVRDVDKVVVFDGEAIVDLTWNSKATRSENRVRWTDMVLYEVMQPNAPVKFMLQIVGRSIVYHGADGCMKGVRITVSRLYNNKERYEQMVACPVCRPTELDDLDLNDVIGVEEDRYSLRRCATAQDVIEALRDDNGVVSGLGQKLLFNASEVHDDFRAAMTKRERL